MLQFFVDGVQMSIFPSVSMFWRREEEGSEKVRKIMVGEQAS